MEWHKPPFKLNEIKIEVTHDCLLRCIHCSSLAEKHSDRSLTWEDCRKILDDSAEMGTAEVSFSGGEPLLWPSLKMAIARASKLGMKVFLYTTGNVPEAKKMLDDLKIAGLNRAMFSVFGTDYQSHDKITASEGSFQTTIDVVAHCKTIGLETEIHFVPFSHNYQELPKVAAFGKQLGVKRISVLRLVPQGRGREPTSGPLNNDQNIELRKIIVGLRKNGHDIRVGSPYNFIMLRERPQCSSGIDRLTIGPDLLISPCDAFKHISPDDLGTTDEYSDLSKYSIKECWEKSSYLKIVRKYLTTEFAEECRSCKNLKRCLSGCMAQKFYAYGELLKCPDPMCLLGSKH